MKHSAVRVIALSFILAGLGFFAFRNAPDLPSAKKQLRISESAEGKRAADIVGNAAAANVKVAEDPTEADSVKLEPPMPAAPLESESREAGDIQKNAGAENEDVAVTRDRSESSESPAEFHLGKMELNLSYVMEKDQSFLLQNAALKRLLDEGKRVSPEDINFPEGFRLSLRFEPRCLNLAASVFDLEQLDEHGKFLVDQGQTVFIGAKLRQNLRGDELMRNLQQERCVGSAGADLPEEPSAISLDPKASSSQSTAYSILRNAGLLDLYSAMSFSAFGNATAYFGVVDTGVNTKHPDLRSIASGDADDKGHGTMVAGTAAAPANGIGTVGSMPFHALVRSYKINIAGQGSAYTSVINNGITRAAYEKMDVINVSWSGFTKGSYNSAIKIAVKLGSLVVGAAGNYTTYLGTNVTIPGSIAVGALAGTTSNVASYSNYGPGVEIYTPGTYMTTTMSGGYSLASGTSFASPLVGGIGLMIRAWGKSHGYAISPATMERIILQTGRYVSTSRGNVLKMQPLAVFRYLQTNYPRSVSGSSLFDRN